MDPSAGPNAARPNSTPPRDPAGDAVLVFVRAPEMGRVKTRLAAEIGARAALRVYRRLAEHTLTEARALGPGVAVRIHHTPADAGGAVRAWLGDGPAYLPQADADLGGRMRAAFAAAFGEGFRRVVIIGSDLPGLTAGVMRDALARLETHAVVLGPARDGGYYLLGMREMIGGVFDGVPWSTDGVLRRTMEILRETGIEPALLETLGDVDVAADLPEGWEDWAREEDLRPEP